MEYLIISVHQLQNVIQEKQHIMSLIFVSILSFDYLH